MLLRWLRNRGRNYQEFPDTVDGEKLWDFKKSKKISEKGNILEIRLKFFAEDDASLFCELEALKGWQIRLDQSERGNSWIANCSIKTHASYSNIRSIQDRLSKRANSLDGALKSWKILPLEEEEKNRSRIF